MREVPTWAQSYLARISMDIEAPSLAYLTRLIRARLRSLAFENVSKMHYLRTYPEHGWYIPDIETYVADMLAWDFAGLCHAGNSGFEQLLAALGFDTHLVSFGSHMGTVVRLEDRRYYTDVAVGGPTHLPADVTEETWIRTCGYRIHFYPDPDDPSIFHMDHGTEEASRQWTTRPLDPVRLADCGDIIAASNRPGSSFASMLLCQLWQPERDRVLSLVNSTFTVRHGDGTKDKQSLATVEDIEQVLALEYGLDRLPVREAVETLAGLGVDVFAKRP